MKQMTRLALGHTFAVTNRDATMPTQQIVISMCDPLENHNRVGAYQKRSGPSPRSTADKYCPAGRIPRGPISPRIWKMRE